MRDGTGAQCDLAASDSEIQGSAASISLKFRSVVLSRVLRLVGRAWFNAPGSLASWRPPPVTASAATVLAAAMRRVGAHREEGINPSAAAASWVWKETDSGTSNKFDRGSHTLQCANHEMCITI